MSQAGAVERPALSMGSFGLVVGWRGPLGPVVARFDRWSRERPTFARGLGHPGADLPVRPVVRRDRDGLHVAWCEDDGAWTAVLDLDGQQILDARRVIEGAQRVAFGGDYLFATDPRGIVALDLAREGDPIRLVSERREGFRIHASSLRDEAALVFAHPEDRTWGIACLPRGGAPNVVKLPLREPCRDLRVRGVGGRAAVTLALTGGEVRFALIGSGAKVIERPHVVFPRGLGTLSAPDIVWTDDRWTALARRVEDDTLLVQPVGGKGVAFSLPRCAGPFAARYFKQRLYALEVEPKGEEAELRLWRVEPDGGGPQQRVITVASEDRRQRRAARDVHHAWRGVAHFIETSADYRHAPRPAIDRDGTTLRLSDEHGALTVTARPTEAGHLALRVASARGPLRPTVAPSLLGWIRRWLRLRLSAEEQAAQSARQAWARRIADALGATLESVEVAGDTLVLLLAIATIPDPETFERWLRRLREEHSRGV